MAATEQEIINWFRHAEHMGATHLIVVCDDFDYQDYPVHVKTDEDVHEVEAKIKGRGMQRIMEIYRIDLGLESQLAEQFAWNY